jgi:DNA-binding response OmpR family regulator
VKVLVVEDDAKVAGFVARVLREEGYIVDLCASGTQALRQAETDLYDLIILDWVVPDLDGLSVCRELRRKGSASPILMLTARGDTRERVLGLESGADDYLVKPFEVEELVARVRALLRRTSAVGRVVCGELELNPVTSRAALHRQALSLTNREFALLLYLARRESKVVTRSELLSHVWETKFDPGSNLIEVHISRLREKFGSEAWMIETVRGRGYRLRSGRDE